ncbi:MAG: hypothetical protein JWP97_5245 [Labilithrix sp.]|nr:hypothetical protein [Labilithrix sp.]
MTRPRLPGSIRFRLFLVSFAVCLSIVTALLVYLPSMYIASLNRSLEAKASTYGKLLSKESESAVAFDDHETAREVFSAAAQDSDVRSIALFKDNGEPLHTFGDPVENAPTSGAEVVDLRVLRVGRAVRAVSPVVAKEGARGYVVVELSTEAVDAEKRRVEGIAGACFGIALVAAFAGAWYVGRSLARRLGGLAAATRRVAAGDLSAPPVEDFDADEVGELVGAFNTMQTKLKDLVEAMQKSADEEQARLDGLVRARTAELAERNADMRLVLDHVGQGLFTIDTTGQVIGERSRVVETWFGVPDASATVGSVIAGTNEELKARLEMGWAQVVEDVLPLDIAIAEMPSKMERGGRSYEIAYTPIHGREGLCRALVVVSDCTSEVERARAQAAQAESINMFERILADRRGFLDFFAEASGMVSVIATSTEVSVTLVRTLHTLKGNAAVMGLDIVAACCHALEDDLEQSGGFSARHLQRLQESWAAIATKTRSFAGEETRGVRLTKEDLDALSRDVANRLPRTTLLERIERLGLDPAKPHLERLADQGARLAARLDKSVKVSVDSDDVRLFEAPWGPFFGSLVHVVRNAVDHGLEPEDERLRTGKNPRGHIALRAFETASELVFELADDGRGVDWARVAAKARLHGLPCTTQHEATEVLFHDGVSTRDSVSELSGRGVGLGAVRAECRALGGHVRVSSRTGDGLTISFRFPKPKSFDPVKRRVADTIAPGE